MDSRQKIELLKKRAQRITQNDWKKGVLQFCEGLEKVHKIRNIVAHDPMVPHDGTFVFRPYAAAKMLRDLDVTTRRIKHTPISECQTAVMNAEKTLNLGLNLIENFKRFSAEYQKRWNEQQRTPAQED
jgi:hypothetical protein